MGRGLCHQRSPVKEKRPIRRIIFFISCEIKSLRYVHKFTAKINTQILYQTLMLDELPRRRLNCYFLATLLISLIYMIAVVDLMFPIVSDLFLISISFSGTGRTTVIRGGDGAKKAARREGRKRATTEQRERDRQQANLS